MYQSPQHGSAAAGERVCIAELNRLRLNAFAAEFRYACFDLWDEDGPGCKLTAAVSTGPLAIVVVTTFTAVGIATAYGDYYQDQSWVAHGQLRYKRRYSYEGEFSGSYQEFQEVSEVDSR